MQMIQMKNSKAILLLVLVFLIVGFIYSWERFFAYYHFDYGIRKMAGLQMKGTKEMQDHFSINGNFEKWLFWHWTKQILFTLLIFGIPMIYTITKVRKLNKKNNTTT
jgi:ABC-type sugar transport system permease subunit